MTGVTIIVIATFVLSGKRSRSNTDPGTFGHVVVVAYVIYNLVLPRGCSAKVLLFKAICLVVFVKQMSTEGLLVLKKKVITFMAIFITFLLTAPSGALRGVPVKRHFAAMGSHVTSFAGGRRIPTTGFSVSNSKRITRTHVTMTADGIMNGNPKGSMRHSFLDRTFSSFVCTVVVRRLKLMNKVIIIFLCIYLLIQINHVTGGYSHAFPTFLVAKVTLLLIARTLFGVVITMNLTPIAKRPLPLVDGNNASAFVGYTCVNVVLDIDHCATGLRRRQVRSTRIPVLVSTKGTRRPRRPTSDRTRATTRPATGMLGDSTRFRWRPLPRPLPHERKEGRWLDGKRRTGGAGVGGGGGVDGRTGGCAAGDGSAPLPAKGKIELVVDNNNAKKRVFPTVSVTGTVGRLYPSTRVLFMNTRKEVRVRHIPSTNCQVVNLPITKFSHGRL